VGSSSGVVEAAAGRGRRYGAFLGKIDVLQKTLDRERSDLASFASAKTLKRRVRPGVARRRFANKQGAHTLFTHY